MDTTPQQFTIDVPAAALDDLRRRVENARWPEEQEGVGSEQGLALSRARELASAWIDDFDWRAVESRLNERDHVHTVADGAHVHAVHRRAASAQAPVLVLLHGWPGSFFEFDRLIDPLAEDFHLVIPSLPGFGFSGATPGTGWGARRMAGAIAGLMEQLGYERYHVHGTDWGAATGRWLSIDQAERVALFHTCGAVGVPDPDVSLSEEEERRAKGRDDYMYNHSGYALEQAQRPMTLGYSLTDSAVGQLAWIAEKLVDWADPETPIDRDAILTTASIY